MNPNHPGATAAIDLNNKLREERHDWLVAVGYATEPQFTIVVYTTSLSKAQAVVEKTYQNFPVEFKKTGKIKPA